MHKRSAGLWPSSVIASWKVSGNDTRRWNATVEDATMDTRAMLVSLLSCLAQFRPGDKEARHRVYDHFCMDREIARAFELQALSDLRWAVVDAIRRSLWALLP
eukprot:scaffold322724_cov50-Prasinocladus_malaysianus.AAC.2